VKDRVLEQRPAKATSAENTIRLAEIERLPISPNFLA
jgi:hypothetical protein